MRRLIAGFVAVALLVAVTVPAHAGSRSTDIALGLAAFAVFNQVVGPMLKPRHAEASYRREVVHHQTVVTSPAVVYASPVPVVYATPAPVVVSAPPPVVVAAPPSQPTVIQYPHGRYELRLQGYQYVWVWIPAVPPPPAGPPPELSPPPSIVP